MQEFIKSINNLFSNISDYRVNPVSYSIKELLFLFTAGTLSGCNDYEDICDWGELRLEDLRQYMEFYNGIPHPRTLARVISHIKKEEISALLSKFTKITDGKDLKHIALDGKYLGDSLYSASAFETKSCLTIGQSLPYTAGNELSSIKQLIESLYLKNSVITIDAIGCNREIFDLIKKSKADAIIAVKGNNKYLHSQITNLFTQKSDDIKTDNYEEVNKGHGRVESRKIKILNDLDLLPETKAWPHIKSVIEITSTRYIKTKETTEKRYYVATNKFDADKALSYIRSHWAIENNLHWVLDVNMKEDTKTHLVNNARYNIATIKRFALNILKTFKPEKSSIIAFQRKIARDNKTMHDLFKNVFLTYP